MDTSATYSGSRKIKHDASKEEPSTSKISDEQGSVKPITSETVSKHCKVNPLTDESNRILGEDEDDCVTFYQLLIAVKEFNLKQIQEILKAANNCSLLTKQDKNNKDNTLLHIALKNINEETNISIASDIIKYLIEHGAQVDRKNAMGKSPTDLLEERCKKDDINWDAIKIVFKLKHNEFNKSYTSIGNVNKKEIINEVEFSQRKILPINCSNLQLGKRRSCEDDQNTKQENTVKKQRNNELDLTKSQTVTIESQHYSSVGVPQIQRSLNYQLNLVIMFLLRIPDEQNFFLATDMKQARMFDDIVVKYQINNVWRYRFIDVKYRYDENRKIQISECFTHRISSPFSLKLRFDSFCRIKKDPFFKDVYLEEFLICTNVDFSNNVKQYFEYASENGEDRILGETRDFEETGPQKYRLNNQKFNIIKEKLNCSNNEENDFFDFAKKFGIIVNYKDSVINKCISKSLKGYFQTTNNVFATAYLQDLVNKWFAGQNKEKNKYLQVEDRRHFLKEIKNMISSQFVAEHSSFYIAELKSYGIWFENPLSNMNDFIKNEENTSILVTSSPKLSTIKIYQSLIKLNLTQNGIIFLFANKLKTYEKNMTIFFYEPAYYWLIIECQRGEKINKSLLNYYTLEKNKKKILIVGQAEDILDLSKNCIYDNNNSYKELEKHSQVHLLKKHVIFQGEEVGFDQLLNISSARKIIDETTLEKLILDTIEIGDDYALNSETFDENCYITRTLVKKELEPHIFRNEVLLAVVLFFITGISKNDFKKFDIKSEWIFTWKKNETYKNGIVHFQEKTECDDVFLKLCQDNKNVYWIEYVNGTFLLKKISDSTFETPNIFLREDDLCNKNILGNKIMIIANGPGYGKSTFLTKVARQLKKIMPEVWVIRVNLASHAYKKNNEKSLEDISFLETEVEEAIQFLADICISIKYKSQNEKVTRAMFIESLLDFEENLDKYPKIILLFDGFDEISPRFKVKTLILLKALKDSNITQMWITTRVHEEHSLEEALESTALFLKPLNDNDKVEFISKFWKNAIEKHSSEAANKKEASYLIPLIQRNNLVEGIAKRIIEELSSNKRSDFTDNLLQLKIFTEIVFPKITMSSMTELKSVQLSFLYEEFVNTKFKIYCEDKNVAGHCLTCGDFSENNLKYLRKCHQKIAFNILFPQYDDKQFQEISDKVKFQRVGLLIINDDKLQFLHRSFAEYFVGEYFAENLGSTQIQLLFFEELLPNENYQLIRTFLNNNQQFLEKLSKKPPEMVDVMKRTNYVAQFYEMANEQNYNLIINYLRNLPCDLVQDALLFNLNEQGETILHFFCRKIKDEKIFIDLLDAVKNSLSLDNLKDLVNKIDNQKETIFHHIFKIYRHESFSAKKLKSLLDFVQFYCSADIVYVSLLQANNQGNTALHMACKNSSTEIVFCLIAAVKDNAEEFKKLLLKTNYSGETVLHSSIKSYDSRYSNYNILKLQGLLHFLQNTRDSELIKSVIFKVDNKERTVLHNACNNTVYNKTQSIEERIEMLFYLLELLKNDEELLNKTLLKVDNHGQTALHYTVYKFENSIMLKTLLDFVQTNCKSDIVGELVSTVDNYGCNILHFACCGNREILNYLSKALKNYQETLQDFLFKKDIEGNTALNYALFNFSEFTMPQTLLDFVKINCDSGHIRVLIRNVVQYILSPSKENINSS